MDYADGIEARVFLKDHVAEGSALYTDQARLYHGLVDSEHQSVNHSVGEYARDQVHTYGTESFWSMLKRGYIGTYHWMSLKHLHRCVYEFAGRANVRELDTLTQTAVLALGMVKRRMRWQDLTAGPA